MQDILLHHTLEDESLARRVYEDLLAKGIHVWSLVYDVLPSEDPQAALKATLETSQTIVALMTKKLSRHIMLISLLEQAQDHGKVIIPVIADRGVKAQSDVSVPIQLKRRYAAAIDELAERLETNTTPQEGLPPLQEGNFAYTFGDYEAALKAFQSIEEDSAVKWYCLGSTYNALRQHDNALDALNKAIEADDQNPLAYISRSLAHGGLNQHAEALKDDERALELEPDQARHWSSKSMTLMALGAFDEARVAIAKAKELEPDTVRFIYQTAVIEAKAGNNDLALESLEKTIELDPTFENATIWRRIVWGRMGMHEEALADVNGDIRKNPRKGGNFITRSLINFYLERYEDAAKDATQAIERGAEHQLAAFYNRAIANWKLGNQDQAFDDMLEAIGFLPELKTEAGIRNNTESEFTGDPGIEILQALRESGQLTD